MRTEQKWMKLSLLSLAMVVILTACGGAKSGTGTEASTTSGDNVKITLLNSKSEINSQLEQAAKDFQTENPDISLEIIPVGSGQSPFEKASALYASGNPTTMMMLDTGDVEKFKDRVLDLTSEKWMKDAVENSTTATTFDGKNYAFPFSIEGYGFIYNQQVLDQAVGGTFDPNSVQTTDQLEDLFKKITAIGKSPLIVSPMDWSLGAHYLGLAYGGQSPDRAKVDQFITDLKAGKVDLASNAVFNGLMDTFDLMKSYNIDKASPLSGTYERGPEVLGKGEVGIWFQGNWAWPQIHSFDTANGKYGFLPVPVSNNAEDFGNTQISAAVSKRILIDKEKSTPAQQEAAKKFLDWMVYQDKGQDFLVNQASVIPAFSNITLEPADPLGKSIGEYIKAGKIEESMSTLPADHWSKLGASMQKYLADVIDRHGLAQEIQAYWTNVK
ncbi:carbohydrate ABC transporter substrate-binding protein [Paenibacillus sp. JNUCC31]|uniref:ABC transporter substrate-binding protein n=1 Tax=Paenibacillus sp. JNUCC-31 TaxID=2777983 RepID=UPI001785B425|nr:ABC transporter substrate-binding protein [Paenibacillus sp. JNUCC-31]QOS81194.1 carbohydrate ABC transporter substrate-binding protein [Paenibacillus sp. JNUCC-31]